MTLDRLLGKVALLSGLVLSSYNCDSATPSCVKDTDCKGDRICVQSVCQPQGTSGGDATGSGKSSSNPCGNSPLYGKHMWEISGCKLALHMREDCVVGISLGQNQGYDYQYKDQISKYNGLSINSSLFGQSSFDKFVRFVDSPYQNPKWQKVNQALDKYNGYVKLNSDCKVTHLDDCAFIPLTTPFESMSQCKASSYYVTN